MKRFPLLKNVVAVTILALAGYSSTAATYTATTSGSWTSTTTWGGTAPSLNVTSDQIIIPTGVNVTLDNNLTINGATASLDVEGSLTDNLTDTLSFTSGIITGAGSITMTGFTLNAGTVLAFAGSISAQVMSNFSSSLAFAAHGTVTSALYLNGGMLSVQNGGYIIMGQNSNIYVSGGGIGVNGGDLNLTNAYNVIYTQSATAGAELTGSGLNNLTINGSSGTVVTLSSDLVVSGTLNLDSGLLYLNSYNLYLTGDIAATGKGSISSSATSNITIRTLTTPSGALNFTAGSDTVNNLTIQISGTGSKVNLGSDLIINGVLTFNSGMLDLGSNGLYITGGGSISGADSAMYIIATDSGYLSISMSSASATWVAYPIGTATYYSPIALELNSGSASGYVRSSISSGVSSQGYYYNGGTDLSLAQPAVKVTYYVEPDSAVTSNVNIRLMWSAAMEANGLNADSVYISHYTNSAWDISATQSATVQGSLYTAERDNITTFSPFAVFGPGAQTSSTGLVQIQTNDLYLYPNPASDHIIISNINIGDKYRADIMDIAGQNMGTYQVTSDNNTIPLSDLSQGNYFIKLSNNESTVVRKFVKL